MSTIAKPREFAVPPRATSRLAFSRPADEIELGSSFVTNGRTITEADLVAFGGVTGDWHPQHSDELWAAQGIFRGRVAHGMMVLSYTVGLLNLDPEWIVAVRSVNSTFKRPVRIGDTIRIRGSIESAKPIDDDLSLVRCAIRVVNQREQVTTRVEGEVLWRRRPRPDTVAPL